MLAAKLVGARTHNLKGVDLTVRPGEVVAVTGVSGSGKSSLAFDTLYAEGQRRFVESFSPYARQFLERMERPPVESLEPVPAGIAVDRRAPVKSSRSTVATMADLEPYLAALFMREAVAYCPEHAEAARELDPLSAADAVIARAEGTRVVVTYRLRVEDAEGYLARRDELARDGYRRLWVRDAVQDIDQVRPSVLVEEGRAYVVVDRLEAAPGDRSRLAAAIEEAWRRAEGSAHVHAAKASGEPLLLRRGLSCPTCARPLSAPVTGLFSYASPVGACASCRGFGRIIGVDLDKVVPDEARTIEKGAIRAWTGKSTTWERSALKKLCKRHGVPVDRAWGKLTEAQRQIVLQGDGDWDEGRFPGVMGWFRWLETKTYKMHVRVFLARYRSYETCPDCGGGRLGKQSLSFRVADADIAAWHSLEVREARRKLAGISARTGQGEIARRELLGRLSYLERVGLGYLSLDRQARTLSGGEAQRVTLTAALGTSLHNALFVLDEPTVGLHPSDVEPLTAILRELAARGNAILVVEHDPAMVLGADRVVELGPGAGERGGRVVFDGSVAGAAESGGATARLLAEPRRLERPTRPANGFLRVRNARANNLAGIDVDVPLGVLCAVTGPSGSGKSSLAVGILYRAIARGLGAFDVEKAGHHDGIDGASSVRRITLVDQAPLGRTSRGNAATYTKAWDSIRKFLAAEPAAVGRSLSPSTFSFNVEGGRCETCSGDGFETVEMQFLADVHLVCPVCRGRRFRDDVLSVTHRGLNVAEILELTVDQAMEHFRDKAAVLRALGPVRRLGLGYLRIGQPLTTLSGGEAQRLKLARALGEEHRGALYVLDEPSAGLHVDEVEHVIAALDLIVDGGGSVLVVEHDLNIVASADWVIDLGPDAGRSGGRLVARGTPAEVARTESRTGLALAASGKRAVRDRTPRAPTPDERPALTVHHAREHNLKDVEVSIPHGALTVITGPSGSGKSTLAFDVIFAEGQRRFLETLTPYARQFLPTMPRPDVDRVEGVPPSIALEQRSTRAGSKSTVATVTEVAHYLRLLFAKLGIPHCPEHGLPIASVSLDRLVARVRAVSGKYDLLAPVVEARKGTYLDVFTAAARDGITHAFCDGKLVATDDPPRLRKSLEHDIDLVMAEKITPSTVGEAALARALKWGAGSVKLRDGAGRVQRLSARSACPKCGLSVPELDPRFFSFNTAQGRCPTCEGDGVVERAAKRRGKRAQNDGATVLVACPACSGTRLAPVPRAVRLEGTTYAELLAEPVSGALERVRGWRFQGDEAKIAGGVHSELERRLSFLVDVGLDYLSLDRAARTLSGGEMQRLRLSAQLGAGLTGALYVLDEPTIGLHPRDTARLLDNLRRLVDIGSTVLVVEHDADTIRAADHLVDLGPAGGASGGRVVAAGPPSVVLRSASSPTAQAFSRPATPEEPLPVGKTAAWLSLSGARANNLRDVTLDVPLERFTVVAGVSGSGKSTLVRQVFLPALREKLGLVTDPPGPYSGISGVGSLRRAISVDQSPIGRTPRSVPATFLGVWDLIRALYATTPDAQIRGFSRARFSFNATAGGRCPGCAGQGVITHEMSFLPDVISVCPSCNGQRFEPRTLEVRYMGHTIGDVLDLTARQAADLFAHHPKIAAPLRTLDDLGAGYIKLGQGSHTLSGGEAQRLKLSAELTASVRHEPTLYVLDEPTTGLHLSDVSRLMTVLRRLVHRGDTLVVIEHHPLVMAGADWLVELGPEGGARGGRIIAAGPPRQIAKKRTATGRVVAEAFAGSRGEATSLAPASAGAD